MQKPMTDRELLQELVKRGVISEKDIKDIAGPSQTRLAIISLVHTLFCPKELAEPYYVEELQAEYWNAPEHKKWDVNTTKILQHFKLSSDEEALEYLNKAITLVRTANETSITIAYYVLFPEALVSILDIVDGRALVAHEVAQGK